MVMERNPSCDEGACSITSQTRALSSLSSSGAKSGGGTVFGKKPVYAPSGATPTLAAYGQPTLEFDNPTPAPAGAVTEFFGGYSDQAPRFVPAGAVDVVRSAGEIRDPVSVVPAAQVVIPPAGLAIVRPAGQTAPPANTTNNPGTKTAGSDAQISYTNNQPAQQQQGGVQMDAQTTSALAGLGSSLLQGTRDIVVAAITQGGESDRARARAQAEQEIARLRAQGLLTQDQAALAMQNTNTLLASQQQAALAAALAAQQAQQPQGFFASMTTPQKVALGVGSAVLVGGLGFAIWRATRD